MPSEISTNKILLTSKPTESRWLSVSNLPETATEETIKECFERYGRIQSVKIDDQRFAFVAFLDIRTASKAHHAETILDKQQLRTAFYDGSNSIPKVLQITSPVTSSIVEPSSSSPSSIATVTNTLMDKTITLTHEDRDKRTSRTPYSPEENTRHQVVPMKHDSDSSGSKRKTSSINNSKTPKIKSTRRKHENSSSSSERSHSSSKHRRQHTSKLKRQSPNLNYLKTKILKIYHLPAKMSTQSLRETLRNIFIDFKKSSHLLNIKIIDDYALLTFKKSEDLDKALLFIITKSINGIRLKAEPYDGLITENDEYDLMKRSICSDLDIDEYSVKATRTLYIGNLQPEISYQELRETYSVYGDIIEIEIKRQQPQHSQIFAFIQYADIKSVVKALKSKVIHDHSIKLGFGKNQPTNVLWLDDLPSNTTELMLRSFLTRITNLSPDEILDIYIDHRNCQKTQIVQCVIYFTDIISAQNAINSIRGKKLETKRIQVDFASRIFLTRFSDIIQQANQKKNNDRWTNQSHRRYSKVSDTGSSGTRNPTHHHSSPSSSNHSSINHKKLSKSDTDKHANTERIFDWLMQNDHSNLNNDDEEQISNLKLIENKKDLKEIPNETKKIFQTKIIPLQSNSLFIQSDIRLKVYSSLYNQSTHLQIPKFAKTLIKSSNNSIILNPKAHLKHLLNNNSTKQESININKNNEDLLIDKEIDERIRLLDKQIQTTESVLSHSANLSSTAMKYNPMSTMTSLIPPPPSDDKSNISSTKLFDRLNPSLKFIRKPILPPLSVITTFPIPSNTNDSPIIPTPKSMTPSSTTGNQNHSPIPPVSQKPIVNNSPKPTVLKSILKQPSNLSRSTSNETRKAVHIISSNPSLESTVKRTITSDDKKKLINQQIEPTKKPSLKIIKKTPLVTKVVQSLSKTPHQLNKIPKTNIIQPDITKKSSSLKSIQQNKKNSLNKSSISNLKKPEQKLIKHNNKISKKNQTTCMYDRIKERSRSEQIENKSDIQRLKRHNLIINSPESEDDKSMKNNFDSKIFDTEENDNNNNNKINQPQTIISKFNKKKFILKNKSRPLKRSLINESNRSSKKTKINEEQTIKSEIETASANHYDITSSSIDISKCDDQQSVMIYNKEESRLEKDETIKLDQIQQDSLNKQQILNDKSTLQSIADQPLEKTLTNTDPSTIPNDHQAVVTDKSISPILPDSTKPSSLPSSSSTNETLNVFDSRPITSHKHLFPQTLTPDSNLFTPPHQHLSYPLFAPPPSDSPPLSTRTLSTSSCSSIIGNPFYNTMISGQHHCHDKEPRRESFSLRNPSDLYGYPTPAQQMLNSYATEFYRMNDIQSNDPYDIQWDGYITLKTEQAYIKTQLIAGNSQIARITINYWNSDLNNNLRIFQRMRLEEIQLDGVKKHMLMNNDYCILIGEPNGLTPDELCLEKNHLKNGVIQYLNEKKAAGIINILLPGVLQPVYVVHIFPPCQFASEILQKHAPDAYRCVVQNKIEQIYLLFIITSTIP